MLYFSLEWEWLRLDAAALANIKKIIIVEGQNIEEFAKKSITKNLFNICKLQKHNVSIYVNSDAPDMAVCITQEKDLNMFGLITEMFIPFISKANKVYTVSFQPSVMHKGTNSVDKDKYCFFRGINSQIDSIVELEEPNILTGVAAGGKLALCYFLSL